MMHSDESCPVSHRVFKLSLKKTVGRKRRTFVVNKDDLVKELGPGNKNWFEDATGKKILEKKQSCEDANICTPPLRGLVLGQHSSEESSLCSSVPSTFQHLLSSQTSTPSSCPLWNHPSLGQSPDLEAVIGNLERKDIQPSPSGIVKSLGIPLDDSALSWTESLATPTAHSPSCIGIFEDSPEASKQKGLPRVLFSPGPSTPLTDDELGHSLDSTAEEHTDEEINEHLTKSTANTSDNFLQRQSHLVSTASESAGKDASQDPTVVKHTSFNIASNSRTEEIGQFGQTNACGDDTLPLFSQDLCIDIKSPDTHCGEVADTADVGVGLNTSLEPGVNKALSDFFDPPSGAVGKRRCAPSRGKKRKSIEDETLILELISDGESSQIRTKHDVSDDEVLGTDLSIGTDRETFLSSSHVNTDRESLLSSSLVNTDGDTSLLSSSLVDMGKSLPPSALDDLESDDNSFVFSSCKNGLSDSLELELCNVDASTPLQINKKQRSSLILGDNNCSSTPINSQRAIKSILSSRKRGKSSDKAQKHVRFAIEAKTNLKRNYRKLGDPDELHDEEWIELKGLSEQNDTTGPFEIKGNEKMTVRTGQGSSEGQLTNEMENSSARREEAETNDDLFSQVSPSALSDMCEAAVSFDISQSAKQCKQVQLDYDVKPEEIELNKMKVETACLLTTSETFKPEVSELNNMKVETVSTATTSKDGDLKHHFDKGPERLNLDTASPKEDLSLKSKISLLGKKTKVKRFSYPTTKQISTSCPKNVFAFVEQIDSNKPPESPSLIQRYIDTQSSENKDINTPGSQHSHAVDKSHKQVPKKLIGFESFSSLVESEKSHNVQQDPLKPEEASILQSSDISTLEGKSNEQSTVRNHLSKNRQPPKGTDKKSRGSFTTKKEVINMMQPPETSPAKQLLDTESEGQKSALSCGTTNTCTAGFHAASGKKVSVSPKAMQEAESLLSEIQETNFKKMDKNIKEGNDGHMDVNITMATGDASYNVSSQMYEFGDEEMDCSGDKYISLVHDDNDLMSCDLISCNKQETINKPASEVPVLIQTVADSLFQTDRNGGNTDTNMCIKSEADAIFECGITNRKALLKCNKSMSNVDTLGYPVNHPVLETSKLNKSDCDTADDLPDEVCRSIDQPVIGVDSSASLRGFKKSSRTTKSETCSTGNSDLKPNNEVTFDTVSIFEGFSLASGAKLDISEKCLQKAEILFTEDSKNVNEEKLGDADSKLFVPHKEMIELNYENENKTKIQPFGTSKKGDEGLAGFATAGGKSIATSIQSLKIAAQFIADVEPESDGSKINTKAMKEETTNKNRSVEGMGKLAEYGTSDMGDKQTDTLSLGGFQTAGGKKLSVSEESLAKANLLVSESTNLEDNFPNSNTREDLTSSTVSRAKDRQTLYPGASDKEVVTMAGFSTAGGKHVKLSEESIRKAKSLVAEVDSTELNDLPPLPGFDNALKKVLSKRDSTPFNKNQFKPVVPASASDKELGTMAGFSTAGGKHLKLSEESIRKAKSLVAEVDSTELNDLPPLPGFDNALKEVFSKHDFMPFNKNQFKSVVPASASNKELGTMAGFSTAGGKHLKLSEESIRKAKSLVGEVDSTELDDLPPLPGFDDALQKVLSKRDSTPFNKNQFKPVVPASASNKELGTMAGFSTAGGKHLKLSEESIQRAKSLVAEVDSTELNDLPSLLGFDDALQKVLSKHDSAPFNKNQFRPVVPAKKSDACSGSKEIKTMKSALTASRFPPGSNVPKGYRPFKAPKITQKIQKTSDVTQNNAEITTEEKQTSKSKAFSDEDSRRNTALQKDKPVNDVGVSVEKNWLSEAHVSVESEDVKPFEDPDLDMSVMNQLFGEEFDSSQKFSSKNGKVDKVKANQEIMDFEERGDKKRSNDDSKPGMCSENTGETQVINHCGNQTTCSANIEKTYVNRNTETHFSRDNEKSIVRKKISENDGSKSAFDSSTLLEFDENDPLMKLALMDDMNDSAYADIFDDNENVKDEHTHIYKNESKVNCDVNISSKSALLLAEQRTKAEPSDIFSGFKSASGKDVKITDNALTTARKHLTGWMNEDEIDNKTTAGQLNPRGFDKSFDSLSISKDSGLISMESVPEKSHDNNVSTCTPLTRLDGTLPLSSSTTNVNIPNDVLGPVLQTTGNANSTISEVVSEVEVSINRTEQTSVDSAESPKTKKNELDELWLQERTHFALEELMSSQMEFTQVMDQSDQRDMPGLSEQSSEMINRLQQSESSVNHLYLDNTSASNQGNLAKSTAAKSISETGLKHAFDNEVNIQNDDGNAIPFRKDPQMDLFKSASGKAVAVSDKAMQHARNIMDSASDENIPFQSPTGKAAQISDKSVQQTHKTMEGDTSSPFQSASGKAVNISDSALQPARKTMDCALDISSPFQSAAGKAVTISESALQQARKTMDNALDTSSPFQSAAGKAVTISESALQQARKTMDSALDTSSPFQSASGKAVTISESALQQARKTMDSALDTSSPFQSASGKAVTISESALQQARKTMDSACDTGSPFQSASGKAVTISESALKQACKTMDSALDTSSPFQSAAGKAVTISESALQQARKTMDSVLDTGSPFQSASGKAVTISESALKQARKTMDSALDTSSPFQSAAGKAVTISESALQQARKTMDSVLDTGSPFQSASGKAVTISESALKQARKTMDSALDTSSPFQSAAGKAVTISESALQQARKTMDSALDTGSLFQSASGKAVSVSDNVLRQAKKPISDDVFDNIPIEKHNLHRDATIAEENYHPGNLKKQHGEDINKALEVNFAGNLCPTQQCMKQALKFLPNKREAVAKRKISYGKNAYDVHHLQNSSTDSLSREVNADRRQSIYCEERFEDLFHPDDFLEEMEIPQKRRKTDGHYESVTSSLKPLIACPDILSKDRQSPSHCLTPVRSIDQRTREMLTTSNNQSSVQTQPPTNSVFKTPYKASSNQQSANSSLSVKQPKFIPKCATKTPPSTVHSEKHQKDPDLSATEQSRSNVCSSVENMMSMVQESRKHQMEIIQRKEKTKIKPTKGRLMEMKNQKCRIKLRDVISFSKKTPKDMELLKYAVERGTLSVRGGNAVQHKFYLPDYYTGFKGHVFVGDGSYLVPDDSFKAGKYEFYRAFLTVEGVDGRLISEDWFNNHYRWIVWKLASYEIVSPGNFAGRSLNPEMVMLQMKYRYDKEIDSCQRSCLKRVMERDDAAAKRMVLCVSDICHSKSIDTPKAPSTKQQTVTTSLDEQISLKLTDGWYTIAAKLDVPLQDLVRSRKIQMGQKICTTGAELVGSQDACSPLEAPPDLMLKINANSTRPIPWETRLGYQSDPRPLCVPITGLCGEGGAVGCMDVVLARKYPLMYMEKLRDGGCVFRSQQAEDKFSHEYEKHRQGEMEKLYNKLQKEFEEEEAAEKCITKKKWTVKEVSHLQTGHEIYEAYSSSRQPDVFQEYLSQDQLALFMERRQQIQEERQQKLHTEFKKTWQSTSERNVVPLMKMRFVGCSRKDVDAKASALVTVWRPTPSHFELKEGRRYKIYSLNSSTVRSRYSQHEVQLTASRQTRFQSLDIDENLLDILYESREVVNVGDIQRRKSAFGELDFVGIIISVEVVDRGKLQEMVYAADPVGDILGIRFWGGVKSFSADDVMQTGNVFCACNLLDKSGYRGSHVVPVLEASTEFTLLTQNPQYQAQRRAVDKLQAMSKNKKEFLEKANAQLSELQNKKPVTTPEKLLQETDGISFQHKPETTGTPQPEDANDVKAAHKAVYQSKMSRLLNYGSPAALSPLTAVNSSKINRAFKSPMVLSRRGDNSENVQK